MFFLKRLVSTIPVLWGVVTFVFLIVHLIPGDPVELMLGETAKQTDVETLRTNLGLDKPLFVQYTNFLKNIVTGNLGNSILKLKPVGKLILEHFPPTIALTFASMFFSLIFSFPAGIVSALKKGSVWDSFSLVFTLVGVSMPNFWLGPLLIIFFAVFLKILPVEGYGIDAHLILPALTMGLGMSAIVTRVLRSSMIETLGEDFIRTAKAKGLTQSSVVLKHCLRNAVLPVVTVVGLQFGALLSGTLITEVIFSWPGIGRLLIGAVQNRDYPLIQGCVLAIAISYVFVNLLVDLFYSKIDPRISFD
ncbi:ABC transporter permease [bacterium]|nr:ABC transporter permease [bacterium]